MTPQQFKTAIQALAKEIGPNADIYASISIGGSEAMSASIYPQGIGSRDSGRVSVRSDDFADLFEQLRTTWDEHKESHAKTTIRTMALEIIRITAEHGSCSDAALRGSKFSADEISRYGVKACIEADTMAGKGPFDIIFMGGANTAAA